jgi:hypothetical protein
MQTFYLVSIRKHWMRNREFPVRQGEIFCPGKEIEGLRGSVLLNAAQASLMIDTAKAKKSPSRTETN